MLTLNSSTDLLKLLSDPTRVRLLALLSREDLTVAELTEITGLPQSRISTHLGRLREAALVRDRAAGTSSFYSLNETAMAADARRFWSLLSDTTADPLLEEDRQRLDELSLARGGTWADSVAGQMERHYSPGRTWEAAARGLLGLAHAPRARSVTCLDCSLRVIRAARRRLSGFRKVEFRVGDMHKLPFRDAAFDQVLFMNSLSYSENPERAIREAARVLRPGGDLAAVALKAHRHSSVTAAYNHQQAGFEPRALRELFGAAGFDVSFCDVTSRERRSPYFQVITLYARRRSYGASE
jgi:ArsR family transcriptional regulator